MVCTYQLALLFSLTDKIEFWKLHHQARFTFVLNFTCSVELILGFVVCQLVKELSLSGPIVAKFCFSRSKIISFERFQGSIFEVVDREPILRESIH